MSQENNYVANTFGNKFIFCDFFLSENESMGRLKGFIIIYALIISRNYSHPQRFEDVIYHLFAQIESVNYFIFFCERSPLKMKGK